MPAKLTQEDFIERSKTAHGDEYEYFRTVFKRTSEKVIITCRKHGDFEQHPSHHMNGHGCFQCGLDDSAQKRTKSPEDVIRLFKELHGDRYDYSRVIYQTLLTPVEIICRTHGPFWQSPAVHLNRNGCKKCRKKVLTDTRERPELCDHGCGRKAEFYLAPTKKVPTGRWRCSEFVLSCEAVKDRRKETNIERIGVANPFEIHNANITEEEKRNNNIKREQTCVDRFGMPHPFHTPEAKANSIIANKNRYKPENILELEKSKRKTELTILARYGSHAAKPGKTHYRRSKIGDKWLDSVGVSPSMREIYVKTSEKAFRVDGMSDDRSTIYEFNGDYWHGNPQVFEPDFYNPQAHATMQELYERTQIKEKALREAGYQLVAIWEKDFRKQQRRG